MTTNADATSSGSGAGIAVGVFVTDSKAYIDSTAATPVTAKSLTISADTDNTTPTKGTSAPGGADKAGNGTSANSPTQSSTQTAAAGGKADNKSKTADGNQNVSAALAVTVLVATTQAYISPTDASAVHTIDVGTGALKIHAGAKNTASATADAGNVKFAPDAPTLATATSGGSLADSKAFFYKLTAVFVSGEGLPSSEATIKTGTGSGTNKITLTWTAVDGATNYKIYRSDESGKEELLDTVGAVTTYTDDGTKTPSGALPTTSNVGIAVAVAVNVAVINTTTYLAHDASLKSGGVTLETTAPAEASAFKASSTSGAGGSSVGVAGSIAVNVVVANATSDVEGTDPVAVNGADLSLSATSNLDNQALATAKQATDGSASGVGISVAVNVVNDTTTAGLPDNAVLNGAKNLTINSTGTDSMTTTANGGASTGSGTVALAAQAAIAISNVTTTASVGTGPTLDVDGRPDGPRDPERQDDHEGIGRHEGRQRRASACRSRS